MHTHTRTNIQTHTHTHLQVSFIEMARSTLPLFTLGALYLAGLEQPNVHLVRSVLLIVLGCCISAYGEVRAVL